MSASLSIPPRLAPVLDDLTPAQRAAALALGRVLVLAGAGTGKTKTLTAGVATRIELYGMEPSRILCVTFTNKAAREMRERITRACGEGMAPSWLGTFHALCARQLRAEPDIAYLRAGFDIRDADDTLAIVRRLIKATPVEQLPRPEEGEPGDARQIAKMAERISSVMGWTAPNGIAMCQGEVVAEFTEEATHGTNYPYWHGHVKKCFPIARCKREGAACFAQEAIPPGDGKVF